MDLDALGACLVTPACVVTQTTSGLIVGMLLFLVAAGVTLIFGVLKIVNFAHGTFYMLGGYVAYTAVLTANQAYQQARLALVQAEADRFADTAALFQALGGGWWHQADLNGPQK